MLKPIVSALLLMSTAALADEWKPPQDVRQYCGFLENEIVLAYNAEVMNNRKAGAALEEHAAPYEFQQDARVNRESRLQSEDEWQRLGCAQILYRTNPPPR